MPASTDATTAGARGDTVAGRALAIARLPRRLVAATGIYFVAFVAWRLAFDGGPATRMLFVYAAYLPPGLAAVVLGSLASRRSVDPRTASAWRWLTASFTCLVAAFAADLGYETASHAVPLPSAADACYLAFYVLFFVGVLRFPRRPPSTSGKLRLTIDFATVALAGMSVIWLLVLGPSATASRAKLIHGGVAGVYPVVDLLAIFVLAYLIANVTGVAAERALRLLVGSAVLATIGDVAIGWRTLHPGASLQLAVDLTLMAAWLFFVLAASVARSTPAQRAHPLRAEGVALDPAWTGRARWLPYLGPLVVFGLLLDVQFGGSYLDRVSLTCTAVLVCALVLLRQFLGRRDLVSAQSALSHQALHDALTGLPNRTLVRDRLERMLARARRQLAAIAVLYVDVDGFKQINDTLGHAAGDALLQAVGERLSSVVREADTVGRLAGDEFVVLLDAPIVNAGAKLAADRILDVLRQPIELGERGGGREATVSVSIGAAVSHEASADQLLHDADVALYEAKSGGKDRYALFRSGMQGAAQARLLLELDLRDALSERQLFLLYQPTVDLASQTITGVEALLRWHHPTRGVVGPEEFIPIAEDSGLIVPIGRWVLAQACEQVAEWRRDGHAIGIAVNVSARQLDKDGLLGDVERALKITGLDAGALTLEITETTLMLDTGATASRLGALKELGIRIAIDDFGTGYSSLAYLARFPVDAIKIDRSFVSGIAAAGESHALIHTFVQLGKALGLETIAEGIEEDSQLRVLQRERCDSGQGFLFARPLEPDEVVALLSASATAAPAHDPVAQQPSLT
jgi:diguanylate cyclase (GGDEF)-like protein